MSKQTYIHRFSLIIKKLKTKPYSSYEELQKYIESQSEYLQLRDDRVNVNFSKRTLQRDIKEINNIFGIDIEYSKANRGYFINPVTATSSGFERVIEAFNIFNSLNLVKDVQPFIHLEKRKPVGTESLHGILHAIKNKVQVKFSYLKFEEDEVSVRTASPYALKEFKNRWYLLAADKKDSVVKSFALDRLSNLEVTSTSFNVSAKYNVEQNYNFCFGIIRPEGEEPQEIILSFDPLQGKYIKSLPLHDSQIVLIDNDDELRVSLRLYITHDLVMELLSFGSSLKVLKPDRLAYEIMLAHKEAFMEY